MPLHAAAFEHEIDAAVVLEDLALLGENRHAVLGIALVVDEDAEQLAVRPPLADVQHQAAFDAGEAAGLNDVADEIGADLGRPVPQLAQAPGREIDAERHDEQRDDGADHEEGHEQHLRRHAGRIHHDQFGIVAELVQHVGDGDHQRDRRDDHEEQRNDQAGDADEDQDALTLIGHQVDVAQRLSDPHERGHAGANQQERTKSDAKNIAPD